MFAHTYFTGRYFPPFYFPPVAAIIPLNDLVPRGGFKVRKKKREADERLKKIVKDALFPPPKKEPIVAEEEVIASIPALEEIKKVTKAVPAPWTQEQLSSLMLDFKALESLIASEKEALKTKRDEKTFAEQSAKHMLLMHQQLAATINEERLRWAEEQKGKKK